MLTALLLLAPAPVIAPAAETPSEVAAAGNFVALLDAGRWDESWQAAGVLFQSQMPQGRWSATIQPVRTPLGAAQSRSLAGTRKTRSLPGAPDGDYVVVQYRTDFASKAGAIETLVLSNERGGWKVDGYFIH